MDKRRMKLVIKNMMAFISCILFTFLHYFLIYTLLKNIISDNASLWGAVGTLAFFIVCYFAVIIFEKKLVKELGTKNKEISQMIQEEYDDVMQQAQKINKKLSKVNLVVFDGNSTFAKGIFNSPGAAVSKSILITSNNSIRLKYQKKGIIAHELGHIDSGMNKIIMFNNIINFFLCYIPRYLIAINSSMVMRHYKKKVIRIICKTIFSIFLFISWLTALPYNLFFALLHNLDENYADQFACLIGCGNEIKYFFSENELNKTNATLEFLLMPYHLPTSYRLRRTNRLLNYSSSQIYYHYDNERKIVIAYNGEEESIDIDAYKVSSVFTKLSSRIKKVTLSKNVQVINKEAFKRSSIVELHCEGNLLTIEEEAFMTATRLEKVVFSEDTVINISKRAFANCTSLHEFTAVDTVMIDDEAFMNSGLEVIKISDSIKFLGYNVFKNTPFIKKNNYLDKWLINFDVKNCFIEISEDIHLPSKIDCDNLCIYIKNVRHLEETEFLGQVIIITDDYECKKVNEKHFNMKHFNVKHFNIDDFKLYLQNEMLITTENEHIFDDAKTPEEIYKIYHEYIQNNNKEQQ